MVTGDLVPQQLIGIQHFYAAHTRTRTHTHTHMHPRVDTECIQLRCSPTVEQRTFSPSCQLLEFCFWSLLSWLLRHWLCESKTNTKLSVELFKTCLNLVKTQVWCSSLWCHCWAFYRRRSPLRRSWAHHQSRYSGHWPASRSLQDRQTKAYRGDKGATLMASGLRDEQGAKRPLVHAQLEFPKSHLQTCFYFLSTKGIKCLQSV